MPASPAGTVAFTPMTNSAAPLALNISKVSRAEPQLSRTYYQDGRLLTAVDLNRDYEYLDQRLLDLGLALGDGIITGLDATLLPDRVTISVTQGRGIAPSGRVIAYVFADAAGNLDSTVLDDIEWSGLWRHRRRALRPGVVAQPADQRHR
jgi:hypothetical protein